MKSDKSTIVWQKDGRKYKLFKVIFHSDGSYFITAPYHKEDSAFLYKCNVNYQKCEQFTPYDELFERMDLNDESKCLKLSHHPDGFLQFSGKNIKSGRNLNGTAKGMGIQSWPLDSPSKGPAFGVTIKKIDALEEYFGDNHTDNLIISANSIVDGIDNNDILVEGHYIPIKFISYISIENGTEHFSMAHPTGINIKLHVIRPKKVINSEGFFGLRFRMAKLDFSSNESGFILSSSSGNVEIKDGKIISGVCMYAIYPNTFKDKLSMQPLNWETK